MSLLGIIRQLRLFVPASLMVFVILARRLRQVLTAIAPDIARLARARPDASLQSDAPAQHEATADAEGAEQNFVGTAR